MLIFKEYQADKITTDEAIKRLTALFYTVVVNYAAYAYNTVDYKAEWDRNPFYETKWSEEKCWLSALFHKNDSYQTPIVLNPFRESGNVDYNNERSLTQERLFRLVLNQHSPLSRILHKKDAKAIIIDLNYEYFPKNGGDGKNHYASERIVWAMQSLRLIQNGGRKYHPILTEVGDCIVNAWSRCIGFDINGGNAKLFWDPLYKERVCAINYLVYKTLKMIYIYLAYSEIKIKLQSKPETNKERNDLIREAIKNMYDNTSHVTLKIRRCLAYLLFNHYTCRETLGVDGEIYGHTLPIDKLNEAMKHCLEHKDDYLSARIGQYGSATLYPFVKENAKQWTFEELMPAPFYHSDLLLQDEDGNKIKFNTLSSGEKQMIHSISAILYQIGNIESAWENKTKQAHYKDIMLVFDEIELYFHPKYQLKLVGFLIEVLQDLHLKYIKSINVILSTYSPFILSDIPISDIIGLKDGKPADREDGIVNSFCSNVFDILTNLFFMKRYVGDFVQEKLNALVKRINNYRDNPSEVECELLKAEISLYGDEYLRMKLINALQL